MPSNRQSTLTDFYDFPSIPSDSVVPVCLRPRSLARGVEEAERLQERGPLLVGALEGRVCLDPLQPAEHLGVLLLPDGTGTEWEKKGNPRTVRRLVPPRLIACSPTGTEFDALQPAERLWT